MVLGSRLEYWIVPELVISILRNKSISCFICKDTSENLSLKWDIKVKWIQRSFQVRKTCVRFYLSFWTDRSFCFTIASICSIWYAMSNIIWLIYEKQTTSCFSFVCQKSIVRYLTKDYFWICRFMSYSLSITGGKS